jgi:ubiquinone/menaquinone biosynthesis C-methylase UbiE
MLMTGKIYNRFLKRGPGQMLDLAGFKDGDSFLDLCCGTGRATIEAVNRGASSGFAIDRISSKISPEFKKTGFGHYQHGPIKFRVWEVREFLNQVAEYAPEDERFDCIFCQQAINYWLKTKDDIKKTSAELVSNILTPNGKFVFNTFNTKPSEDISVKEYEIDGVHYAEVSQLVDGVVHHGQFCEGLIPDHQEFDWISSEEFMTLLKPYFKNISIHSYGPTDIYVCSN